MPGIHIAALVAAAIALAAATLVLFLCRAKGRQALLALLALQLPMSAATFYFVRVPIDALVRAVVPESGIYTFLTLFYAPVTEEPAKLWPLLLPFARRILTPCSALPVAVALGVGFGVGEIGFLAERVARGPGMADLPWHAFGPFVLERVLVSVWHVAFVAVPVFALVRRPSSFAPALLAAMALHFIGNFPIYLASTGAFGLARAAWLPLLQGWTILYTVVLAGLLAWLALRGRLAR